MKIIEIGVGTGGATRLIMETLAGKTHYKRYKEYCFTDVMTSFLPSAQEEFAKCNGVDYRILDIEKDPLEQRFEADYDLVIASQVSCTFNIAAFPSPDKRNQVLHVTAIMAETVQNARRLLKLGGKLFLLELTRGTC